VVGAGADGTVVAIARILAFASPRPMRACWTRAAPARSAHPAPPRRVRRCRFELRDVANPSAAERMRGDDHDRAVLERAGVSRPGAGLDVVLPGNDHPRSSDGVPRGRERLAVRMSAAVDRGQRRSHRRPGVTRQRQRPGPGRTVHAREHRRATVDARHHRRPDGDDHAGGAVTIRTGGFATIAVAL
jgi:hypothetical protein